MTCKILDAPQLLDCPDELLLLILEYLDPNSLLHLATLCRRLHLIALPMFFTRHGMDDPAGNAEFTILDSRKDPLSALQMALFIPAVTRLSCSWPQTSIHRLRPHIRRLRVLFTRLAFVRHVTLVLDIPSEFSGATDDDVEAWALELRDLLNMILKRGCISLTLRYGHFSKPYQPELRHIPLLIRPVAAFRNVIRHILPASVPPVDPSEDRELLQMGPRAVSMELDSEGRSSSALTQFSIESPILLLPPCFDWSLSALRHSPVSRLEFVGIDLPTRIWSVVLPPIAGVTSALTELNLSNLYGISGMDILHFLAKLPGLKMLTIGYTEFSRSVQSSFPDSGPIPKLHQLTVLHAPSTFISHMLKKKSLPRLDLLCITPRRLILGPRGMRHIARCVAEIVRQLEKYKLTPTVALEIQRGQDADAEMAADLAPPVVAGEHLTKPLRAITRLVVCSDSEMSADELGMLARWIARFPAVLHVALRVQDGRGDAWASIDNARRIARQNPNLASVELNGKLFDGEMLLKRELFIYK
ncbi:hypothetical protein B0H15DRAFT_128952 [Mycena belliarum]|uniref:F-box domain-containing protein n=1 Tax=Mycena belliarum TaxID=1033014 RepID=A0AAD6UDG6_9AGAR|nr:hypothetical protein B0H15DRAFT_128952 [Mycena belliae]